MCDSYALPYLRLVQNSIRLADSSRILVSKSYSLGCWSFVDRNRLYYRTRRYSLFYWFIIQTLTRFRFKNSIFLRTKFSDRLQNLIRWLPNILQSTLLHCIIAFDFDFSPGYMNRLLSSKFLIPFSRTAYCAYLIHPILMRWMVMRRDSPVHLAEETIVSDYRLQ